MDGMDGIESSTIDQFRRDGAAIARGVLDRRWIELLEAAVEHNRQHPSPWASRYTNPDESVGFWSDYVTWQDVPEYRQVVFESGLADMAKELMGSTAARFFHEHVLVKEPGTTERTPWHHDQPYYCVDGDESVSMWIALDAVPASAGVRFIAGSHHWNRWFVPRKFVDHTPYAESGGRYELVPDLDAELDADIDRHTVLAWDVEPGDVIAFHFRTLHDAPGNSLTTRRRAVSLRWLGDDATFALRPWLHSPPFEQGGLVEGGPLDDERFPLVAG
jgi:ectoine hydroxylase-related dioxygenase (phytanoyl-CoA dioxygenase family)